MSPMTRPLTGLHQANGLLTAPSPRSACDCFGNSFGSFLKDPYMVLADNFPNISKPITILYYFNTSQLNFIKNKKIKHDETRLDIQGQFNAYLSNALDVLGRLISKLKNLIKPAILTQLKTLKHHETHIST